jgi:hypothetical protein
VIKIGLYMLLGGVGLLSTYGVYQFTRLILSSSVPVILKLAFPAIGIGLGLILLMVIRERLSSGKGEDFKEVDN